MNSTTIRENRELRALARQQFAGARGKLVLATLVYMLISYTLQFVFWDYSPFYNPQLYPFAVIAAFVIMGPFSLGMAGLYLRRVRGREISVGNIFDGFSRFLPSFFLFFFVALFAGLWMMLLVIPGIVKLLAYDMAFYIMHDNPGMGPLEALRKSKTMMMGHKWRYFKLHLSFLGWLLLSMLTFGIGLLWLIPYIYLSTANFYENLKASQTGQAGRETPADPPAGPAIPEKREQPVIAKKPSMSGLDAGTWNR